VQHVPEVMGQQTLVAVQQRKVVLHDHEHGQGAQPVQRRQVCGKRRGGPMLSHGANVVRWVGGHFKLRSHGSRQDTLASVTPRPRGRGLSGRQAVTAFAASAYSSIRSKFM